jgi:uncharacterized damage-inducible protein DinB
MNIREVASTMAAYNRWVNAQIYEAATALSEEERRRTLGGAFGSVHGTLSHLVVSDQVWLQRFRGQPLTWPAAGQDVHADFASLREARLLTDADLEAWAASIDPAFGDRAFSFRSIVYNRDRTVPGWSAVLHLFNHQTHHRGQVMTLLRQLGSTAPISADLPWGPFFD